MKRIEKRCGLHDDRGRTMQFANRITGSQWLPLDLSTVVSHAQRSRCEERSLLSRLLRGVQQWRAEVVFERRHRKLCGTTQAKGLVEGVDGALGNVKNNSAVKLIGTFDE